MALHQQDFDPRNEVTGERIPCGNPHAVSVGLPTYDTTIGYEEGDAVVRNALKGGYPRFRLNDLVAELFQKYRPEAAPGEAVWAFPSLRAAEEARAFVDQRRGYPIGRVQATGDGVALLVVPHSDSGLAKEFWQHSGQIVSSRQAEHILLGKQPAGKEALQPLKELLATYNNANADDVFLYPSGMAAIFNAYKAVTCKRGSKTIQFGFPYTDTLKIQEKFGEGIYVPYNSAADFTVLESHLKTGAIAAVFCEIPGNPLLRTIDVKRLHAILGRYNVPLIIDDTLGAPFDVALRPYAAATVTSLTKSFSGQANVMGGSVILNPDAASYPDLKNALRRDGDLLYGADARVLLKNGAHFFERARAINHNAEALADFLRQHPAVDDVFYPKGDAAYEAIRRPGGGYGGLLSFTLRDPGKTGLVFDNLHVAKGPSLGTQFTLACLYTLLAHYGELEWAESQGVSRNLIRVAVGAEPEAAIRQRFNTALSLASPAPAH